jgi:hypothetical protein
VETGELLLRPRPRWSWAAKNAWLVDIGDDRHLLGKHPEGAPPKPPKEIEQALFHLMAADLAKVPKASDLKVCQVCDLLLDYSDKHHATDTFRADKESFQDFCEL